MNTQIPNNLLNYNTCKNGDFNGVLHQLHEELKQITLEKSCNLCKKTNWFLVSFMHFLDLIACTNRNMGISACFISISVIANGEKWIAGLEVCNNNP